MKRRLLLAALVLAVGIQFVPVELENPPVTGELMSPSQIRAIFERSCYDCHSNETDWPWYSRVAPVSWLVARDIEEGREHLNFSQWEDYSAEDKADLLEEIAEEVKEREMPLWFYVPLHPSARLSDGDIDDVVQWASSGLAALPVRSALGSELRTWASDPATASRAAPSSPPPSL